MRYNFRSNQIIELNINPGKTAIAGSDQVITWEMLKDISEKIGYVIENLGIPCGHPVMIYGHKEAIFPAVILGLMLKDIPYIPIDTIYPYERIKKIIELSGTQVVFNCTGNELDLFDSLSVVNNKLEITREKKSLYPTRLGNDADPLRYIIFTSGSTGEPKGVQITREAMISFIEWIDRDFMLGPDDVFMNQAPFSFDLSVYELSMYLHFGGTIVLNEGSLLRDYDRFFTRLQEYRATVWISTPSFAYLFLRDGNFNCQNLPSIHTFLFCGETLPVQTAKRLLHLFDHARVLNTYGPTEATVATTLVNITTDLIKQYPESLPVGYCKGDSEILIVNETDDPGEPGEIVIVGNNVSIGYLNQKELNEQVFSIREGRRAYATGDSGYTRDGLVFHLGRMDDQVKLHGFRIELNEITSLTRNFSFVDDAVTIALKRDQQVKKIITFVILKKGTQYSKSALKQVITDGLSQKLPDYMLPADICEVAIFPMSANHKIDKNKLAEQYLRGD